MNWAYLIIGLVALQRLAEVAYAERNTRALLARGAVEIGRAHYPLIVALHAAWLIAILIFLPKPVVIHGIALVVFIVLQGLRLWVLATLGPYWTTRIITLKDAPLVRRGPYRFIRHPNYAVVVGEIAPDVRRGLDRRAVYLAECRRAGLADSGGKCGVGRPSYPFPARHLDR